MLSVAPLLPLCGAFMGFAAAMLRSHQIVRNLPAQDGFTAICHSVRANA
jgi:hypothetical protein